MHQGERVKVPEGTRQKSRRNFGISLASMINWGRSESSSSDCLSKTQVPAQLVRGCIGAET